MRNKIIYNKKKRNQIQIELTRGFTPSSVWRVVVVDSFNSVNKIFKQLHSLEVQSKTFLLSSHRESQNTHWLTTNSNSTNPFKFLFSRQRLLHYQTPILPKVRKSHSKNQGLSAERAHVKIASALFQPKGNSEIVPHSVVFTAVPGANPNFSPNPTGR